jgi:lysyl endopeptidase
LPTLTGLSSNDAVTINTTYPNGTADAYPSNNPTVSFNVTMATQNTHTDVTVQIVTDRYGEETTWDIKDDNGAIVASGGPWTQLSANGTTPQTPVDVSLAAQTCHTVTIYDTYGDGIDAGYGAGSFTVTDGYGSVLATGGQFVDEDGAAFKTGNATVDVNDIISNLSIYPNPVKNVLTIEGDYTSVNIYDISNKLVLSSESQKTLDMSSLSNGVYFANIKTKNTITVKKITVAK